MIISASRRTDIPAFYSHWLINRLRAGWCSVPNPFNLQQVSQISLAPQDVDVLVFWTRSPRPLLPYLDELDRRGYRYYFQFTLMDNPPLLDPHHPPTCRAVETFRLLADRIGAQRVIWRYDPIVLTSITPPDFHRIVFGRLAEALRGSTIRCVISFLDIYGKIRPRLAEISRKGAPLLPAAMDLQIPGSPIPDQVGNLARDLSSIALQNGMEIVSCAEQHDLKPFGVRPGKCIDDELIARLFGLDVSHTKDPGQRPACGCVQSRDIGMYNSCLFGCRYCYTTGSFERSRLTSNHDPQSPSLFLSPLMGSSPLSFSLCGRVNNPNAFDPEMKNQDMAYVQNRYLILTLRRKLTWNPNS